MAEKAIEVWGIPTCDTVNKTLKYLEAKKTAYVFKNFRETPPSKALLQSAMKSVDAPKKMFNTSGKAYRAGGYNEQAETMTKEEIVAALLADPMLIKRPIVRATKGMLVGFDEKKLDALL